nr:hypothetical protein [Tanacetum cinerariifolium]
MESVFHISGCAFNNQVMFATCTLLGAALTWWNGHVRTLGHDAAYAMTCGTLKKKLTDKYCPKELALMCTKFLADETKKVDKYIDGLPDKIHENVMSARPKTLDETIMLANHLMNQKLRTYTERQNDNKRKADDSSRNNQQQQPHKKQNVARCNNFKKYGHATRDCCVIVNNNNNSNRVQNTRTCFKCGEPRHFKKNFLKLKNNGNANGNGRAPRKTFVLGGGDSNPKSNTVTGTFDIIIGMDWLREYHAIIVCDEKKYLSKGCDFFLAHVTMKGAEDKLKGKQLEDVLIVRDFPKVFPEDLPEPVEIMDREIKQLKRSHIPIIKFTRNSKRGPEFTWEREDKFKLKLAMSPDNAQSAVTYTSISSNSDGPSWGIPLMNADHMELDEHVPAYVLEPEHPEYHAPSDDDTQVEDDDKDPEEDPSEEHEPEDDDEDPEEDPNEEHEPEDEDTKEPSKGSDETEPFKEDEICCHTTTT